jgi:DNA-binding MarR family transcriptional regulator
MDNNELSSIILDWSAVFMRLSMHDFTHFTRTTGMSFAQMIILLHLYYRGPSEVMAFTELMQVSPAGASQMIERMVQQGLVLRQEVPGDRRVRIVRLADAGKQIVEDSIAARRQWIEQVIAALATDQKEAIGDALLVLTEKARQLEPALTPFGKMDKINKENMS